MLKYYSDVSLVKILLAMAVCLAIHTEAWATDAPTIGLLYSKKEVHSLVFNCKQDGANALDCEFVQTTVRRKSKPEELGANFLQERAAFKRGIKLSDKECDMYSEMIDVLEGRKKPPKAKALAEISGIEKTDMLNSAKALRKLCGSGNEKDYLEVVRLSHDKNTRTCRVSSNAFRQSFKLVHDDLSGAESWVVQGGAEGPCGVIQLSRFEPEKLKDSKYVFWKYVAKKAVTNPNGEVLPGASCKNLDEAEYVFGWRSKEYTLGCDYIEFSP